MRSFRPVLLGLLALGCLARPAASATPGDVLRTLPTPGSCPTGLAYDGARLWLADRLTDTLYAVDPKDGRVVASLDAPGFIPLGLAWDGRALWVLDGEEKRIAQLDPATGTTLRSIEAPSPSPQGLAWDGAHLWLADDKKRPADVADSIGHLDNRALITTEGGGGSELLAWGYNTNEQWTAKGPVKVHVESVGEWSPER